MKTIKELYTRKTADQTIGLRNCEYRTDRLWSVDQKLPVVIYLLKVSK